MTNRRTHIGTTVVLVTQDDQLERTLRRNRPPDIPMECKPSLESAARRLPHARELWLDLDCDGNPPAGVKKYVYFHSRARARGAHLPVGVFVRKPCTNAAARRLWARLANSPSALETAAPVAPRAWLPPWITEFHELNLRELCRRCTRRLPQRLGFADASLYLHDPDSGELVLAETTHRRRVDIAVPLANNNTHLMAAAARGAHRIAISNADAERRKRKLLPPEAVRPYSDTRSLVVPLYSGGRLLGVLNLSCSHTTPETEVGIPLDPIFTFIADALRNARVYERARAQARIDPLTGLFNARWVVETLAKETGRAARSHAPLALIHADVDHLKKVNDYAGHAAGDCLLRYVAERINEALRHTDSAARVGGDEFVILLPASELAGAQFVAERVLERLREGSVAYRGKELPTQASLGIAQWQPGWTPEQLIEAADHAMYRAKEQGRNQIAIWDPAAPPPSSTCAHHRLQAAGSALADAETVGKRPAAVTM